MIEKELNENHKKNRMLKNGGKNLDEILSMGIMGSQYHGLGYQPGEPSLTQIGASSINFVKSKSNHEAESIKLELLYQKGKRFHESNPTQQKKSEEQKIWTRSKRGERVFECFHCVKIGHVRSFCYKFKDKIIKLWSLELNYLSSSRCALLRRIYTTNT